MGSQIDKQKLFDLLGYKPHQGQRLIHDAIDKYRHVVGLFGRRAGKSFAATYETIYQALQPEDHTGKPPLVYIVSDTYNHSKKIFNPLSNIFSRDLKAVLEQVYQKDQIIKLKTGAEIHAKSAENTASLTGDDVSFVLVDESGFVSDLAIERLYPSITNRLGKFLAIGTPDSNNWFRSYFYKGLEGNEDWISFQLPSNINPKFPKREWERLQRETPEQTFRKYYLAEFLDDESSTFSNEAINNLFEAELSEQPYDSTKRYVAGIDLAKTNDFTVVTVLDVTKEPFQVVKIERWNKLSWEATAERIAKVLSQYGAKGLVDTTGVGNAVFEMIQRHYLNVEAFVFTQKTKQDLIERLVLAMEQSRIKSFIHNALKAELSVFKTVQTSNGTKFTAPNGLHDDMVISLALALKKAESSKASFIPRSAMRTLYEMV
ncbi:MAG: terminase family protein [Candidatus Diapherotrites archaeon]